jgi:hypothetical protein
VTQFSKLCLIAHRVYLGSAPAFWSDFRRLWHDLARAQLTFWDGDDSEGESSGESQEVEDSLRTMCGSLARFTRNLVAGIPQNQTRAMCVCLEPPKNPPRLLYLSVKMNRIFGDYFTITPHGLQWKTKNVGTLWHIDICTYLCLVSGCNSPDPSSGLIKYRDSQ